jgi:hypothetical protein
MKKILQHKFENYTLDASNSEYRYVIYNKDETIKDDKGISNSILKNSSYININIELKIKTSPDQLMYLKSKNSQLIQSLKNKDIDFDIFNKVNSYSEYFFKYYHDKKSVNMLKLSRNIEGHNDLIEHHRNGYVLNLNKKYEKEFKDKSKNASFSSEEFLSLTNNEFIEEKKGTDLFFDNYDISLGMKNVSERLSYGLGEINNNSICLGFLIEKYNDNKELLGKIFVLNETLINAAGNVPINEVKKSIKDSNVRYGQKYKYVLYPTFLVTLPKMNDYHLVKDYIMCDTPYIVNIDCVEKVKPNSPDKLFFNYILKENKMLINWTRPYNTQNDIKGYYIFKRHALEDPYEVIGVVNFSDDENIFQVENTNINSTLIKKYKNHTLDFVDTLYNRNKITIYTIASYDAHGNISDYSEQISVIYDYTRKKLLKNIVSLSGAPLHLPNIHIPRNIKFFGYQESIEDVVPIAKNKSKITLYCTPDFVTIKNNDEIENILLKENYIFNIFKLENQKSFSDVISIKNFKNINNE